MTTIQIKVSNWLDLIFVSPILLYRLLRFGCAYRRLYLGQGKWTLLDVKDYYRFRIFKWVVYGNGHNLYAIRLQFTDPNKTKTVYMHREIMNPPAGLVIDHKNCDGLDNRKDNLRFATHAQNTRDRRKKKNGSSQFLGVYFNKEKSTWDSQIMHNGKKIWVGRFQTQIDAAKAYDEAARKYHGEFARLNFAETKDARPQTEGRSKKLEGSGPGFACGYAEASSVQRTVCFARLSNEGQRPSRARQKGIADACSENILSRRTQSWAKAVLIGVREKNSASSVAKKTA